MSYPEASHQQILLCQPVRVEMPPSLVFAAISFVTQDKNPNINLSFNGEIGVLNTYD